MNEETVKKGVVQFVREHKFLVLVFASIVISIALVMVALSLYVSSGTAQLDLSRPANSAIRDQVKEDTKFTGFDSNGTIDKTSLDQFDQLYSSKLKEAESVDAFGNDVLSPESLQIDQGSASANGQGTTQ